MVDYSKLFHGLEHKPDSYKTIADNYEWERRDVENNYKGRIYDDFNAYLDNVIGDQEEKLIVECGCGLGPNLLRHKEKNFCIGFDFSKTALEKLNAYTDEIKTTRADICNIPLRDNTADYVIFSQVLFVFEDLQLTAKILKESQRILRPGGKVIIVNDYCSVGVELFTFIRNSLQEFFYRILHGFFTRRKEFICYYFSVADMKRLLNQADLTLVNSKLCDIHQGVYHLTYLNMFVALLFRNHKQHNTLKRKDHWQRVENASDINDAYPLNWFGRQFRDYVVRRFPQVAALRLCCLAEKRFDI